MAKPVKDKPHIQQFYKETTFKTAIAIGQVLQVIQDLKDAYPVQAAYVRVVDVHLTETYGHNDQKIVVKWIYINKPQKGVQQIELDQFTLQDIIDKYL